jgi:hypothetical protein
MTFAEWARQTTAELRAAGFTVIGGTDSLLVKRPPAPDDVARMIKFAPTLPCVKSISAEGMLLTPVPPDSD